MYAIISTGGKQYKVQPGDVVQVEKLENDLGSEFEINDVLLVGGETTLVGQPLVKNAKVTVVVTKQARTRKVIIFKKKRRQGYRRLKTHKQEFTELFVKSITTPDGKTASTDAQPNVKDMAKVRTERIATKVAARKERVENKGAAAEPKKATATKKKAVKKVAKKASKKPAKKATVKKTAKKTTKKA